MNQTLTSVNDCVVRLAVIDGELIDWHSHEHEDEFFLVLDGRLELEVKGREPFVLVSIRGIDLYTLTPLSRSVRCGARVRCA